MPQMAPLSWFPLMMIMAFIIISIMVMIFWSMPLSKSLLKTSLKTTKNMFWKW